MTAFADTIVFMTVIMMAVSITVLTSTPDIGGNLSPDRFLDMVSDTEIRLSDMTDLEDDSLIRLPDAVAYSFGHGSLVRDYLKSLLDTVYGPGCYCLSVTYEGSTETVGEKRDFFASYASEEASVSVGGRVLMELEVYA